MPSIRPPLGCEMEPHISPNGHVPFEQKVCTQSPGFRINPTTSNTCTINSDIFFSPNCTRPVELPDQTLTLPLNGQTDDPSCLLRPQWFSVDAPHLAFFPLSPLSGDALNGLFSYLPAVRISSLKGFSLDPEILLKWNRMEFILLLMAQYTLGKYQAPKPKDVVDKTLVCIGTYKNKWLLEAVVSKTIDWFSERAALMSYAIAVALSMDDEQPNSFYPPAWFSHLVNRPSDNWDQTLVSSVHTTMGQFIPRTRVGVLLQVVDPNPYQYSVDWLCGYNVPVWYPWGAKEIAAAANDPIFACLAPPVAEIQRIHTILHKSPAQDSEMQQLESAQPWISFFEEKQRRIDIALKTEDPKCRQARESREKKPPVKNTKVFVWEENLETGIYVRNKVSAKWNEDTLAGFSHSQRRYDVFNNEWDCRPFGNSESDTDEDTEYGDDIDVFRPAEEEMQVETPHLPISSTSSAPGAPTTPQHIQCPTVFASSMTDAPLPSTSRQSPAQQKSRVPEQYRDDYEWDDDYECSEILQDFFGFVPSNNSSRPNFATAATSITDTELMLIRSIVGLEKLDPGFEKSQLALEIMEFIRAFMSKTVDSVPRNEIWDLSETNHRYVGGSWRFRYIRLHRTIHGTFYVFNFGGEYATVNWDLGVTNAVDALYICRLHWKMTDYDICRCLLQRGIQFHTFLTRKWTSIPLQVVGPPLPVRLEGYQFTQKDYSMYRSEFFDLLKNPRIARSALMRGGIVWRLVVSHVGFHDVFLGPTTNVTLYSRGFCVDGGQTDTHLWDNDIAQEELDAIVGAHVCMTGQGKTFSIKSWWPTDKMWNSNSPRSFWNPLAEQKYQKRLQALEEGTAKPFTSSEWRSWVCGPATARNVSNANLKSAEALLERSREDS